MGKPADIFGIDYLQLMRSEGRFPNRQEEVSSLSRGTKLITQVMNDSGLGSY
jgi:replicative DNA helicase